MSFRRVKSNRFGSSFMEYAIVLGLISLVLTGMNIYIKRGIQGKVKDMTDYFFKSKEQAADPYPTAIVISQSDTASVSSAEMQESTGGGRITALSDGSTMEAVSTIIDTDVPYFEKNFVAAEEGQVEVPQLEKEQANAAEQGASAGSGITIKVQ